MRLDGSRFVYLNFGFGTSGHHGLVQSFQAKKVEGCLKLRVSQRY